jgi:single-strand DNA-binding protein
MNKVFFIGNLTKDPELTETPSGIAVCRFSIAVNRNYTNGDGERKVDFFNCTAWRGLGETIARYTAKGKKIAVTGSIELRDYEDNNGIKRTAIDAIVQDCEFLTPKERDEAETPTRTKPTLQDVDDDNDIPF